MNDTLKAKAAEAFRVWVAELRAQADSIERKAAAVAADDFAAAHFEAFTYYEHGEAVREAARAAEAANLALLSAQTGRLMTTVEKVAWWVAIAAGDALVPAQPVEDLGTPGAPEEGP